MQERFRFFGSIQERKFRRETVMIFSINPGYIAKTPDCEPMSLFDAAMLCKKCGYDGVDLGGFSSASGISLEELRRFADRLREGGVSVVQTHAPFNRYKQEKPEVFAEALWHAFRSAVALGAGYIVIHGDEYIVPEGGAYSSEDAVASAIELFKPYVSYALDNGLGVAFENVFEDGYLGRPRPCSRVEELIALIDAFGDRRVGCCWDFGHAAVSYKREMLEALRRVGGRLVCTHVHDNMMKSDSHLPPFLGAIDWDAHAKLLREIGYDGAFSFEFVYGAFPEPLKEDLLRSSLKAGKYILQRGGYEV